MEPDDLMAWTLEDYFRVCLYTPQWVWGSMSIFQLEERRLTVHFELRAGSRSIAQQKLGRRGSIVCTMAT